MDEKKMFTSAMTALKEHLSESYNNENFSKKPTDIHSFIPITENEKNNTIAFLDGGNAELIATPEFALHLLRAVVILYKQKKKVKVIKKECMLLASAKESNGKFFLATKTFGDVLPPYQFDAYDHTLTTTARALKPSDLGSTMRRILELSLASEIIGTLEPKGMLVLDGDLTTATIHEEQLMASLKEKASQHNVILTALAKTSEQLHRIGTSSLITSQPGGAGYYSLALHQEKTFAYWVKLHKNAKHSFKLEVDSTIPYDIYEITSSLISLSKDAVFLGYPYGLIEADQRARVTNEQAHYLASRILAHLEGELEPLVNSMNAHAILDRIQFGGSKRRFNQ